MLRRIYQKTILLKSRLSGTQFINPSFALAAVSGTAHLPVLFLPLSMPSPSPSITIFIHILNYLYVHECFAFT